MKTTQEMIAVMQAFADGKEIESRSLLDSDVYHHKWGPAFAPIWNWFNEDYRIKPEPPKPKIVPYESAGEFLSDMRKHGPMFGKVGSFVSAIYVCNEGIITAYDYDPNAVFRDSLKTYQYIHDTFYIWQDGTPCGKEVIE